MLDPESRAPHRLSVREIAEASGVAPSAVRFYEKRGLITAIRTAGNQRRFDDSASCRIRVARLAQSVGLTVNDIADLFADLPAEPSPDDWGAIGGTIVNVAEQKIADLKQHLVHMGSGTKLCEL
jgi:MerR family redox-sensitive transcriptional activator SoxR